MPTIAKIARIPLFEGLPSDQLEDLACIVLEVTFKRGQSIFSEGEAAEGFYVVDSGRVKVFKLSPDGKEMILHLLGPGEPFGEVPVFEGGRFPAHAVALEESRCLYVPRSSFIRLVEVNPSLALNMLAVLSRRLRKFTALVDALSLKEVPGRLAAHLLHLSHKRDRADSIELDMPKAQLAAALGTIPETLSRILTRMAKQGIIESEGARVRITDRQTLTELAEGLKRL